MILAAAHIPGIGPVENPGIEHYRAALLHIKLRVALCGWSASAHREFDRFHRTLRRLEWQRQGERLKRRAA